MDGTLIPLGSSWELLHRRFGTYEVTRKHMDLFFQGKISYEEWARLDVSLWVGRRVDEALDGVEFEPHEGVPELISELKSLGVITGMISSGLDVIARKVAEKLDLDFWASGRLKVEGGVIKGIESTISPKDKFKILVGLAERLSVPLSRVAFVGDDFSDIHVFRSNIGLKVAFRPRNREIEELADLVARDYSQVRRALMKWLATNILKRDQVT